MLIATGYALVKISGICNSRASLQKYANIEINGYLLNYNLHQTPPLLKQRCIVLLPTTKNVFHYCLSTYMWSESDANTVSGAGRLGLYNNRCDSIF